MLDAETTVVLNADWFWSASEMKRMPEAVSVTGEPFLVTSCWNGVPITAASLVPWMVKDTCFWVPSKAVTVKVSVLTSLAPRYCTALSATV